MADERQNPLGGVIGMLGLGAMGAPIAGHLLTATRGAGGELVVLERSASRFPELVARGLHAVSTPREIAARARVVVAMVPDLPQVIGLVEGEEGLLAGVPEEEHLFLIVGSTVSAPGLIEFARSLRSLPGAPIRIVDAPVSGGEEGAEAGTLSIMVGSTEEEFAELEPVLSAYGTPRRLGGVGAGQTAKACNQLIVAATVTALGEASVLAERAGLDLEVLFELLGGGYAASRMLETRARRYIENDFTVSGAARYMEKDLAAASRLSSDLGAATPLLDTLLSQFHDIVERGYGDCDISVTKKAVEDRSARR